MFDPKTLSHIRHELRTPLNQIIGYSELLMEEAEELGREDFVSDLGKIGQAARRLLALIDEHLSSPAAAAAEGSASEPAAAQPVAGGPPATPAVPRAALEAPQKQASEPPAPPPAADEALPAGGPPAAGRASLLVVDDDALNRDMLARRLASCGYSVVTAGDGHGALQRIGERPFDLVLLDIMMPGISGLDVLKVIRQRYAVTELPVIMATGMDRSADTVQALGLGANDYVTKPLDFPVVLARTETQLSLKRATEEIQRLAGELELRNEFIQKTFGRYLSDEIVSRLLETPEGLKLGGEKRTVTILMSDLRGFTAMAERLAPEQVVRILNIYLGAMAEIISSHQGTIDEFIGDAILALFGAPELRPDDARRAVACAVAMQRAMEPVNEQNRREGLPEIQMGIAVHTGEVVVGNIGSQKRAKYGVVGSPVNLTGRIESFTVGGQVLISESALRSAGDVVKVDGGLTIEAKGVKEPVAIYNVRGIEGEYGLFLAPAGEGLQPLGREIPVRWAVLEGKHVGEAGGRGGVVRLSLAGAEVRSADAVEPLAT